MTEEILHPKALVLPKMTTAVRDTLVAEVGTIIYDTTTGSLSVCNAAAAGSWTDFS